MCQPDFAALWRSAVNAGQYKPRTGPVAAIVAVLTAIAMLTAESECILPMVWLGLILTLY